MPNNKTRNPTFLELNPHYGAASYVLQALGCIPAYHCEHHPFYTAFYAKKYPMSEAISLDKIHPHNGVTVDIIFANLAWNNISLRNAKRNAYEQIVKMLNNAWVLSRQSPSMIIIPLLPSSLKPAANAPLTEDHLIPVGSSDDRASYMTHLLRFAQSIAFPHIFYFEVSGEQVGLNHPGRMLFLVMMRKLKDLSFDIDIFDRIKDFGGFKLPASNDILGWEKLVDQMPTDLLKHVIPTLLAKDLSPCPIFGPTITACARTPAIPMIQKALSEIKNIATKHEEWLAANQDHLLDINEGITLNVKTSPDAILPAIPYTNGFIVGTPFAKDEGKALFVQVHPMPPNWRTFPPKGRNAPWKYPPMTSDTNGYVYGAEEKRERFYAGKCKKMNSIPQLREEANIGWWDAGGDLVYAKFRKRIGLEPLVNSPGKETHPQLNPLFVMVLCGYPMGYLEFDLSHVVYDKNEPYFNDMPTNWERPQRKNSPIMDLLGFMEADAA